MNTDHIVMIDFEDYLSYEEYIELKEIIKQQYPKAKFVHFDHDTEWEEKKEAGK